MVGFESGLDLSFGRRQRQRTNTQQCSFTIYLNIELGWVGAELGFRVSGGWHMGRYGGTCGDMVGCVSEIITSAFCPTL